MLTASANAWPRMALQKMSGSIALALLLGLVTLLPIVPWPDGVKAYNLARGGQLLLLPLLTLGLWFIRTPPSRASTCLVTLGALAVLHAAQPGLALRDGVLTLTLLLAIPGLSVALRDDVVSRWTFTTIVAGQALYTGLIMLLLLTGLLANGMLDYWHLFAGYENPRYFNHAQTPLIALLAGIAASPDLSRHWRRLALYALIANFLLLLLMLGRATCVGVMAAAAVMAAIGGAQGRAFVKRLFIGFLGGALLYVLVTKGLPLLLGLADIPHFRDVGERGSIEARFYLWRIALTQIGEHPWLGVGPMHFAHQFNGEAAHPHNIYLQVAAEYGLPFTLLALLMLAGALRGTGIRLRQRLGNQVDPVAVGAYAACVAALVDGLFSGNFVMPISQLWIVLSAALLLSRLNEPASAQAIAWAWRIALTVLLTIQIAMVVSAYGELQLNTPNLNQGRPNPGDHFSPRFWLDGWF